MCKIRDLTEETLINLIRFRASHDIANHLLEKTNENWRDFEEEFSINYPIKACGVLTDQDLLKEWEFNNNTVIRDEVDVSASELSEELSTYPIDTVSLVYMFSVLEVYGDEVTNLINPSFVQDRKAWHRQVFLPKGDPQYSDIEKVKNGFAKPFNAQPENIEFSIAAALAQLKNARNQIVHKGSLGFDLEKAFSAFVAIICHINYLASSDKSTLKVYPWEDYENVFK